MMQILIAFIRNNDSRIALFLRKKIYRTICLIDTNVTIKNRNNFTSGQGSCLYHSCYILNTNGTFVMGTNSHLGAFCYVNACYGNVVIGNDVAIGPGTNIIAYTNHYAKGRKVTDEKQVKDIVIGNNVLIGANCTILPGTTIQDNVIVAAGSVLKGTLETNTIFGGAPCKQLESGWYVERT